MHVRMYLFFLSITLQVVVILDGVVIRGSCGRGSQMFTCMAGQLMVIIVSIRQVAMIQMVLLVVGCMMMMASK